MELQYILLKLIVVFLEAFRIIKAKPAFNSDKNKLRSEIGWIFQLGNSYLSTTILNYAVPYYTEIEWFEQMLERFCTMMVLLRYFRRRPCVVPYTSTDVNHGRCTISSARDSTRVVSLRRERVLDNLAAGLYNVLLRYRFQVVARSCCVFCRALYQNITPCRTLAQIRQWLQLTIQDGMEGQTDAHIRPFLIPEISVSLYYMLGIFYCLNQRALSLFPTIKTVKAIETRLSSA